MWEKLLSQPMPEELVPTPVCKRAAKLPPELTMRLAAMLVNEYGERFISDMAPNARLEIPPGSALHNLLDDVLKEWEKRDDKYSYDVDGTQEFIDWITAQAGEG